MRAVIALADVTLQYFVFVCDTTHFSQRFRFAHGLTQIQFRIARDIGRADTRHQIVQGSCADCFQHHGNISIVRADVAGDKFAVILELRECHVDSESSCYV